MAKFKEILKSNWKTLSFECLRQMSFSNPKKIGPATPYLKKDNWTKSTSHDQIKSY
jgi:hypothetical protein